MGRAQTLLDGAQRAAANTPFQLAAAQQTEQQATARYQSGLSGIFEVADAQRLLTQAEIDDAISKLNVWRGSLLVATAQGSLDPFLQRVQP
jgi:outer membrane protein TolC